METVEDCLRQPDLPKDLSSGANLTGTFKQPLDKSSDSSKPLEANGSQTVYDYLIHSPPFTQDSIARLHSVQLFTKSEGREDNPVPENGVWTWFELAILDDKNSTQPRKQDGIELSWLSHINLPKLDQHGDPFGNNHAMLRSLKQGNVITMRICARFEGWKLYTQSAYLMFEFGEPMSRSSDPNFGQIVSHTKALHEAFTDMNAALLPAHGNIDVLPEAVFQATMLESKPPLRVLSLDGGGVRGVAALILLDAFMKKVAPGKKPGEYFDMIAGTSTGGLIAIMLGRFQMTIDECQQTYKDFMGQIFPHHNIFGKVWHWGTQGAQYDEAKLVELIKQVTKERLGDEEAKLVPDDWRNQNCKVLMCATKADGGNNRAPAIFRSYARPNALSEFPQIKVWEAGRATSAAPTYFAPLTITDPQNPDLKTTFMDGGLQANNPIGWLWNEVLDCYGPAQPVSLFLSIGTGIPANVIAKDSMLSEAEAVASIATNSEISNILFRSLLNAFSPVSMAKKYWRLNVGDGMPDWIASEDGKSGTWQLLGTRTEQDIGSLDDVAAIDQTISRAQAYIQSDAGQKLLNEMAQSLKPITA